MATASSPTSFWAPRRAASSTASACRCCCCARSDDQQQLMPVKQRWFEQSEFTLQSLIREQVQAQCLVQFTPGMQLLVCSGSVAGRASGSSLQAGPSTLLTGETLGAGSAARGSGAQ